MEAGATVRPCARCGETLNIELFRVNSKTGRTDSWCLPCRKEYSREYKARGGEILKDHPRKQCDVAVFERERNLKQKYGIVNEDYDRMLAEQGGCCAICGGTEITGRGKHFHVDHNHDTGKVRGLLCPPCNQGLGLLRDDIARLQASIEYLKKYDPESYGS